MAPDEIILQKTTTPSTEATPSEKTEELLSVETDPTKKKKKRNKNKGETKPQEGTVLGIETKDIPSEVIVEVEKPIKKVLVQTYPPTIPVVKFFPYHNYPMGEIMEHAGDFNRFRITSTEKKKSDRVMDKTINDARKAAEVHRQVRKYMQTWTQPGMKMIDIVEELESRVRLLVEAEGLKSGHAFPTGSSLNNCAAHWTPNPGDKTVLQKGDVLKLDFGVHVNGRIIDSAWTMCWEDQYKPLLNACRESTNAGIKAAGIDVRLGDIGGVIQEVMESHEVEINKKTYKIKPIRNLCGHDIVLYRIHGGKTVPCVKTKDDTKMEENEFYAIETFATTGGGIVHDEPDCSHYGMAYDRPLAPVKHAGGKKLLTMIEKTFGTLAFCRRYLDRHGEKQHILALNNLVKEGFVDDYPPLVDYKGSFTAQFEHTFCMRGQHKEVLSRGDDY
jgi:methionyl aminopeptidase